MKEHEYLSFTGSFQPFQSHLQPFLCNSAPRAVLCNDIDAQVHISSEELKL